jgi:hypothetical protein
MLCHDAQQEDGDKNSWRYTLIFVDVIEEDRD